MIIRAFELEDARVEYPFDVLSPFFVRSEEDSRTKAPTQYEKIDGAIQCGGLSCLVECKDHAGVGSFEPISKLRYQLERRPPGVLGLVFSKSGYSTAVNIFSQTCSPLNIILWTGGDISACLERGSFVRGLQTKYWQAVTHARPLHNLRAEDL